MMTEYRYLRVCCDSSSLSSTILRVKAGLTKRPFPGKGALCQVFHMRKQEKETYSP